MAGERFPFPYLGHGVAAARKTMECTVCFAASVAKADRARIEAGIPDPLDGDKRWTERVFSFAHDRDSLQWVVKACYEHVADPDHDEDPEFPSDAQWKAFNADIDSWIARVHASAPVAFFLKPIDDEYSTETDDWHDWSVERVPELVAAHASAFGKRKWPLEYVASLWAYWLGEQPTARQAELLGALSKEHAAALEKLGALPKVKAKPTFDPLPTTDEAVALWDRLVAESPKQIEKRFKEAASAGKKLEDAYYGIHKVVYGLVDTNRELARVIAQQALAGGVEFESHWWQTLARIELARKDLEAAERAVREVVWRLQSYSPGMLLVALDYHEARGERDVAAMLFHAGKRWFTLFASELPKARAKAFGSAPKDLPKQFVAWLERWIGARWDAPMSRDSRAHWSVWFDEIDPSSPHKKTFELAGKRSLDPHLKMREAKTLEQAAPLMTAVLAASHDDGALIQTAFAVQAFAPELALAMYERVIESENGDGGWEYRNALNNHLYLCIAGNHFDRADAVMPAALAAAPKNPSIFYNAACIAARRDDRATAFERIRLALAHGFSKVDQIHNDEDFAKYRGDAEFEALFPAPEKSPKATKSSKPKSKPKPKSTSKKKR